jgi:hypothetical protein
MEWDQEGGDQTEMQVMGGILCLDLVEEEQVKQIQLLQMRLQVLVMDQEEVVEWETLQRIQEPEQMELLVL